MSIFGTSYVFKPICHPSYSDAHHHMNTISRTTGSLSTISSICTADCTHTTIASSWPLYDIISLFGIRTSTVRKVEKKMQKYGAGALRLKKNNLEKNTSVLMETLVPGILLHNFPHRPLLIRTRTLEITLDSPSFDG